MTLSELIQRVMDCHKAVNLASEASKSADAAREKAMKSLCEAYGDLRPRLERGRVVIYGGHAVFIESDNNISLHPVVPADDCSA